MKCVFSTIAGHMQIKHTRNTATTVPLAFFTVDTDELFLTRIIRPRWIIHLIVKTFVLVARSLFPDFGDTII